MFVKYLHKVLRSRGLKMFLIHFRWWLNVNGHILCIYYTVFVMKSLVFQVTLYAHSIHVIPLVGIGYDSYEYPEILLREWNKYRWLQLLED